MPYGLDLSNSVAKVARANKHLDTLKAKVASLGENAAYAARLSEIDEQGWSSLLLGTVITSEEEPLGLIMGECIHNLRCALDYIVTALVEESGGTLTRHHQFPIFDDRDAYANRVGTQTTALPNGPLRFVTVGLKEVWDFQPFHKGPQAVFDSLFSLYRFSNSDKHRVISIAAHMPTGPGSAEVEHNGTVVEIVPTADLSTWL